MSACRYNSYKTAPKLRKRLEIDTQSFLEMKFILTDNALEKSKDFPETIDHFQALSLIDWCRVSTTRRGEIRQALRTKGIDQDLADKIKDRRKIEEPKALYQVCKKLYEGKAELEHERVLLRWEIAYYKYKCKEVIDNVVVPFANLNVSNVQEKWL